MESQLEQTQSSVSSLRTGDANRRGCLAIESGAERVVDYFFLREQGPLTCPSFINSFFCHERLGTGVLGANVSAVQCLRSMKKSGQDEHRALVAHRGAGGQELHGLPAA
jgi:hypothetical protein